MDREPLYRVYTLGWDDHFIRAYFLPKCSSDEEAVERAKQLLDGHDLEVWESDRKLARLSDRRDNPNSPEGLGRTREKPS